jgi:gliding motility-associated-like protein
MNIFKKLVVFFLLLSIKGLAQTTPNIGFEDGTFNNWETFSGTIDPLGNISVSATTPVYSRQTIIGQASAKVLDPYGLFPVLSPNGSNFSIMLGNATPAKKADRVTYTFTAPSSGPFSIIFNYAVVLENPNHADYQQPKFTATVFDVTDGKYIDCPSFNFVAGSALPGFKLSTVPGAKGASIFYKDWSTATIDLKGYPGKVIRLEFTTNDCTLGGHFGYAYLDVQDNSSSTPITGNAYCNTQTFVTLYGPVGFSGYNWYKNNDFTTVVGTGQALTISPAPPNLTQYALEILPYPGLGECVDTLYTVVNKIDENFQLIVPNNVYGCPGVGVDLTNPKITAGSSDGMSYSYYTDILATTYLANPNSVTIAGTYYIRGSNKEGCMSILPVNVIISEPTVTITDPPPVQYPAKVDLSTSFTPVTGLNYTYYSDASGNNAIDEKVGVTGIYYVKVTDNTPCSTLSAIHVVIAPPAPYTITAPNVFTPNNDGVNDHFAITTTGYVSFGMLKIFNRYGQMVFDTKSQGDYWTGDLNGQHLPAGAYYWVFEGTDTYYNTKVSKGASITIVR